jgi:altronate dehydratase small subunit
MDMANILLRISPKDNVATCLSAMAKGQKAEVDGIAVSANVDIPIYHKIALGSIKKGDLAYKYGSVIGRALQDIKPGDWVHTHNLESTRGHMVGGK